MVVVVVVQASRSSEAQSLLPAGQVAVVAMRVSERSRAEVLQWWPAVVAMRVSERSRAEVLQGIFSFFLKIKNAVSQFLSRFGGGEEHPLAPKIRCASRSPP